MASVERAALPSMRKLADLIKDIFNADVPGHPGITPKEWVEKFATDKRGRMILNHGLIYAMLNQERVPSLGTLIRFGILLRRCGVKIGVFDLMAAAADGIYQEIMEELRQPGEEIEELGDYELEPEDAPIAPPPKKAIEAYTKMAYLDRKSVMTELLHAIARDIRFTHMPNEFEVCRELIREAAQRQSNRTDYLARWADVPQEWIRAILDGKVEEAQEMSCAKYLVKLSTKVPDLDGETNRPEFFAALMPGTAKRNFLKEMEKMKHRQLHGRTAKV